MSERRSLRIAVAALSLVVAAGTASAQSPASSSPHWTYGAWGGLAQNSPAGIFGATPGRNVAVTAIRASRTVSVSDWVATDYLIDVVPAAWVSMRIGERGPEWVCPSELFQRCVLKPGSFGVRGDPAYGIGASPLGVQFRFAPAARLQPYLAASGGMLWFDRPVPYDEASRVNFTADVGGGVIVRGPARLGLMFGYKLHHISNGGTARMNPGLDGHMLYAGVVQLPR